MNLHGRRISDSVVAGLFFLLLLSVAVTLIEDEGAWAQDSPPISVEAKVDNPLSTVGDVVTYTITVTHSPDTEVSQPEPEAFEGFDLIAKGANSPVSGKDRITQEFWYRLRADLVGKHRFPAYRIDFQTPDAKGQRTPGQTAAPKVDVEILSVLNLRGEPKDIHDIKPLMNVSKDWYPYVLMTLAVLLLMALINWLRKKWVRKIKPKTAKPSPEISLSPHELALKELNELLAKTLVQQGKFREYNFELSEIFRRYLGSRYSFPALDWTTEEISVKLKNIRELKAELCQEACSILRNTDWIKFAKGETTPQACMDDMYAIKQFINLTLQIEQTKNPTAESHAA